MDRNAPRWIVGLDAASDRRRFGWAVAEHDGPTTRLVAQGLLGRADSDWPLPLRQALTDPGGVLLALLMALQAGLPPLDFAPLVGRGRARYIAGIHAALDRDYAPLADVFARVISRSRRRAASNVR